MDLQAELTTMARRAKAAARQLALADWARKNQALEFIAAEIAARQAAIAAANQRDLEAGAQAGLSAALLDRLRLTPKRFTDLTDGLLQIIDLPDPVGREDWSRTLPNGLNLRKVRVPIGVILIIYESRPNVTVDAAALCLKAGNATILRGGKEAINSNLALAEAITAGCRRAGLDDAAVQLIPWTDRQVVNELLKLDQYIDLVMPRGGEGLIRSVAEHSRIPVIKHYKGVCHVYVDKDADAPLALKIVENAKCQRPATCNAAETLLIHQDIAASFAPLVAQVLLARGVELRGDDAFRQLVPQARPATEADWYAEYLDLILAVRIVPSLDEAIAHIAKYGSAHSDAIVSRDAAACEKFLHDVDSAAVYANASTRFTDGFEFGMGAEIGISTDRIHARGPMGLDELTIYKYVVRGSGQLRG